MRLYLAGRRQCAVGRRWWSSGRVDRLSSVLWPHSGNAAAQPIAASQTGSAPPADAERQCRRLARWRSHGTHLQTGSDVMSTHRVVSKLLLLTVIIYFFTSSLIGWVSLIIILKFEPSAVWGGRVCFRFFPHLYPAKCSCYCFVCFVIPCLSGWSLRGRPVKPTETVCVISGDTNKLNMIFD